MIFEALDEKNLPLWASSMKIPLDITALDGTMAAMVCIENTAFFLSFFLILFWYFAVITQRWNYLRLIVQADLGAFNSSLATLSFAPKWQLPAFVLPRWASWGGRKLFYNFLHSFDFLIHITQPPTTNFRYVL